MKKSVLLLALCFVLVSFLSAQNDCTGTTQSQATLSNEKPKTISKSTDAAYINSPKDCSKPNNSNNAGNQYSSDGFNDLMHDEIGQPPTKPFENYGHPVPNTQLRTGTMQKKAPPHHMFSSSGSILCCVAPPNFEDYNTLKND